MTQKRKYKIQINNSTPSNEDLSRHKNFSKIMTQYRQERKGQMHYNLQKINRFLPFVMGLLLIGIVGYFLFRVQKMKEKKKEEKAKQEQMIQQK
jgi:CHASE3 domain sensor protein